jgi:hypothetical protein
MQKKLKLKDGSVYEGETLDGKPHGSSISSLYSIILHFIYLSSFRCYRVIVYL